MRKKEMVEPPKLYRFSTKSIYKVSLMYIAVNWIAVVPVRRQRGFWLSSYDYRQGSLGSRV